VALSLERTPNYALDNADIVREAMLGQQSVRSEELRGDLPYNTAAI